MKISQLFYKCLTLVKEFLLTLTKKAAKIASQFKLFNTPKADQSISVLTPRSAATSDEPIADT